jgi:hypothetical protein
MHYFYMTRGFSTIDKKSNRVYLQMKAVYRIHIDINKTGGDYERNLI